MALTAKGPTRLTSAVFVKAIRLNRPAKVPFLELMRKEWRSALIVLFAAMAESSSGFFFLVFGFSYAVATLKIPATTLLQSLLKFLLSAAVLGGALWSAARFAASYFAQLSALRDEAALLLLVIVGTIIYAGSILLLFGGSWLKSLVRS